MKTFGNVNHGVSSFLTGPVVKVVARGVFLQNRSNGSLYCSIVKVHLYRSGLSDSLLVIPAATSLILYLFIIHYANPKLVWVD